MEREPPHRFLHADGRGITIEPCDWGVCTVLPSGRAACGSIACPACGRTGANLSISQLLPQPADRIVCGCGASWAPERRDVR